MRIILQIFIVLLLFSCSNINIETGNPPSVNLVVEEDKYSLILKHHFYKKFKSYNKNLAKFTIKTNLSFTTSNALSNNGNKNLSIVKGTVKYKIFDNINTQIIKSGSISSSVNTGSVSSLYGIDKNNDFVKKRISRYLASKLYRKILLKINHSES